MSHNSLQQFELDYFNYWNCSPLISIHVPIYKRKFLNINYDFVVNIVVLAYLQEFDNWELRLIDNGDGDLELINLLDQVENILDKKINKTKVSYYKSDNNNLGYKRNQLIEHTISPIICNWDDDDLYLPQYLSNILRFFKEYPFSPGIVTGQRHQYNLKKQQRLLWTKNICNGSGYYVLRTDLLKDFNNIRYHTVIRGEEASLLQELTKTIKNIDIDTNTQIYSPVDKEYVRIRFGGNMTPDKGWENDIRIMHETGGDLLDDKDFKWLFDVLPDCLFDRYWDLIKKVQTL